MTVNLQWHDAMTQAERKFTLAERGYGWPQTMEPIQLAELQRPCTHNNQMGRRAIKGLCRALVDACKAKSIDHRTTSKLVQGPYTHNGLIGFTLPGEVKELTIPHITAPAFAAWLAAQGEAPSPYIAAWFEAVDTATPPTLPDNRQQTTTKTIAQATTLTPTVAVGAPGGTGTIWTKERKDAARAMMNEQKGRGIKAFAANTAIAFGVTATRLRKVLNDKPKKAPAKKAKGIWDV